MEALVRVTLQPRSVWTTPWQADSVLGALACMWARFHGTAALRRDFLDPWMDNAPRFVLSDAFPTGRMPAPAALPLLWEWPPEDRKKLKRCDWLAVDEFRELQQAGQPDIAFRRNGNGTLIRHHVRIRNSVPRAVSDLDADTVQLFEVPYSTLTSDRGLTVYARVSGDGLAVLVESLDMLGKVGFGADASVGHGAFQRGGDPEPCSELDDVPDADGFVSLSTFQPAASDPVDGFWRTFIKYGKMAPEFHGSAIFKRPQVMLRPGACFRTPGGPGAFYGTAIRPEDLLTERDRKALAAHDVHPMQAAFALAVPMRWPTKEMVG